MRFLTLLEGLCLVRLRMDFRGNYQSRSMRNPPSLVYMLSAVLSMLLLVPAAFAGGSQEVSAQILDFGVSKSTPRLIHPLNQSLNGNFLDIASHHFDSHFITLDSDVTDPNFNVLPNKSTEKGKATFYVIGLLILAALVPLATFFFFSR